MIINNILRWSKENIQIIFQKLSEVLERSNNLYQKQPDERNSTNQVSFSCDTVTGQLLTPPPTQSQSASPHYDPAESPSRKTRKLNKQQDISLNNKFSPLSDFNDDMSEDAISAPSTSNYNFPIANHSKANSQKHKIHQTHLIEKASHLHLHAHQITNNNLHQLQLKPL